MLPSNIIMDGWKKERIKGWKGGGMERWKDGWKNGNMEG